MSDRIRAVLKRELQRQQQEINLIASENFASPAVLEAQGSILTNKYAEGYSSKRYYEGCAFADEVEDIAKERAQSLFGAKYVNVQPHSGSQANQAAYLALLNPGDTVLSMSLDCGGHLSHGAKVSLLGKWFNVVHYGVRRDTCRIDYEEVESIAKQHRPKLIIVGYSSYSRQLDFARFRQIADQVEAYLLADIAHIAGIVAAGFHSSPLPYAHLVTSTTHKTLRGPRGGLIMTNIEPIAKKMDAAVFPGVQGGPLMHVIAAKAVAFEEALNESFKAYIGKVIDNAQMLAQVLCSRGYKVITGGTDNHLLVVELEKLSGKEAAELLSSAGIICNRNAIPFDSRPPYLSSGIRLGSPACTTRGMGRSEFELIGHCIASVLDSYGSLGLEASLLEARKMVKQLSQDFPLRYSC